MSFLYRIAKTAYVHLTQLILVTRCNLALSKQNKLAQDSNMGSQIGFVELV
jgi:hypothetical protein